MRFCVNFNMQIIRYKKQMKNIVPLNVAKKVRFRGTIPKICNIQN